MLCSDPWRKAFRGLQAFGFKSSFRLFDQAEKAFSCWDCRVNAFERNIGLRIDHEMLSESLARRCHACSIERGMRANEGPSDHAPVIANIDRQAP